MNFKALLISLLVGLSLSACAGQAPVREQVSYSPAVSVAQGPAANGDEICAYAQFEKSWVKNLKGYCAFTLDELKGQGMVLRGNIRQSKESGGSFHQGSIYFLCTGLSEPGVICGVDRVEFDDGTKIAKDHEVLDYGLQVMGRGSLVIRTPDGKWVNFAERRKLGYVMPPRSPRS